MAVDRARMKKIVELLPHGGDDESDIVDLIADVMVWFYGDYDNIEHLVDVALIHFRAETHGEGDQVWASDSRTEKLTEHGWEWCGDGSGPIIVPDDDGRTRALLEALDAYLRDWMDRDEDPAPRYRIVWLDEDGQVIADADTQHLLNGVEVL